MGCLPSWAVTVDYEGRNKVSVPLLSLGAVSLGPTLSGGQLRAGLHPVENDEDTGAD